MQTIALRIAALIVAVLAAAGVAAQGIELDVAPRRFEPQDHPTWTPKSLKAAISRAELAALYQSTYVAGSSVTFNWTGSVAGCNPGTTNVEHQKAVITRINYFRALAGLPAVTLLGSIETGQVQAAALMMSANNALSHTPPASWLCYTTTGASGAGSSNIALGVRGVDAVDLFMDDPGTGNSAAGHRRWILFPPRAAMATGDIAGGNAPPRPANAVFVFGPSTSRPATPNGIAWPPAGFIPYQNLPSSSNRWSLSFPGADFNHASVAVTGPGGPIPVTLETLADGFGDNTIVFVPSGISSAKPASDTDYDIVVSGIAGVNVPAVIRYKVTVIDPSSAGGAASPNYQGLWWNSPAGSEAGWGVNIAQQGEVIFLTWFTYNAAGRAWWLSMTATRESEGRYSGTIYETRGPAFDSVPFNPAAVVVAPVGTGTLAFDGGGTGGQFSYTVNGVTQAKLIEREVFATLPTCTFGAQSNLALATNYQDLWWAAPAGLESGWGVNLTHQGDTIFATWFTYDNDAAPLWLSVIAQRTGPGTYSGTLNRTTGPSFNALPFNPVGVTVTPVGTATFSFANGNAAQFAYTVNGVSQSKQITRQVFRTPGTVCQ